MDIQAPEITKEQLLEAVTQQLVEYRQEAILGRKASGIEGIWAACEEAYFSIDDANREKWSNGKWSKPPSMQGPISADSSQRPDENKSKVFIPLTARYVDAGHAKVSEILIPIDDRNFSFDPTPIPELVNARGMMKQIMSGQRPAPEQSADIEALKQRIEQAADAAKRAEQRVFDWLVEAKFPKKMRRFLFDSARIGVGIIKGPVATSTTSRSVTATNGTVELTVVEKVSPGVEGVLPWNFYPDPSCGEDINNGDYCFEADDLTERRVRSLKKLPFYIGEEIDKVLNEGPERAFLDESGNPTKRDDKEAKKKLYRIWYYYGSISREEALAYGTKGVTDKSNDRIYVIATMINDRVIRVVPQPLTTGEFPYRVFPWRRRIGFWAGIGIAEQCSTAQRICNAAVRAMLTNAGQSAGIQLLVDNAAIMPSDQKWEITPNKVWLRAGVAAEVDMSKAMRAIEIPDRQQSMMNIIEFSFRIAEESTSIPLITQGQSGSTTPDTFGAVNLQNNNAQQLLRDVGATCDDEVTEPLINGFYEWLLLDPDVPANEKGDYQINAHGSSALVERSIQDQVIQQLVEPSLNPAFELNPAKVMREFLKSKRIDPRSLGYTDQEKEEMAKRPQPEAPAITAAKLRSQAMMAIASMRKQTDMARIKHDVDRDTVYVMSEARRDQAMFASRQAELETRRELAMIDYANKRQISLDELRGMLAKTAMTLRTQKELAGAKAPQVATPAVEPPGRAPNGEAFAK